MDSAPSREALQYTDKTKAMLRSISTRFSNAVSAAATDDIENQATPYEAIKARSKWESLLGTHLKATYYKGKPIPDSIACDHLSVTASSYRSYSSSVHNVVLNSLRRAVFVEGYDINKRWATTKTRKLQKWVEENKAGLSQYGTYFVFDKIPADLAYWLPANRTISWEDARKVKLPKAERTTTGRAPGAYIVLDAAHPYGHEVEQDKLDTTLPIYYTQADRYSSRHWLKHLEKKHPDGSQLVVSVNSNRHAKFLRLYPQAIEVRDQVMADFNAFAKTLTDSDKQAISVLRSRFTQSGRLSWLDSTKIDDPELVQWLNPVTRRIQHLEQKLTHFDSLIGERVELPPEPDPLAKYPLMPIRQQSGEAAEHVYIYLNAAYAAEKEAKQDD
jgi:hypothetical protein